MNRWVRLLDAVSVAADRSVRTGRTAWALRLRLREGAPRQRRLRQTTVGAAAVGLTVAVTAVAVSGPWDSGQRKAERAWAAEREADSGQDHTGDAVPDDGKPGAAPAPSAEPVLGALGDHRRDLPTAKGLEKALKPLLRQKALGRRTTLSVGDAATGKELYASGGKAQVVPASTIKLATAAAVLSARGPDHRIPTRTVWDDAKQRIVLVGGGDPTLTEKDLGKLATATARTVAARKLTPTSLGYDTSRYAGPTAHPIGVNNNIAPLTPLMLNSARVDDSTRGPAPRAADPAADAAVAFASLLRDRGVETRRTVPATARGGSSAEALLGEHRSAPLSALVERMLIHSDNDIAEALARQTALAAGEKADFGGAEKAVKARLAALDLPVNGTRFADGSGLSRADRLSTGFLTALLAKAADADHAELRPLLTGLPVAGFNGTLGGRYGTPEAAGGAGLVRAKTGTLTGVNSLAGTVVDADGRLLTFAVVTTGAKDPRAAQNALDALATTLAGCGCP